MLRRSDGVVAKFGWWPKFAFLVETSRDLSDGYAGWDEAARTATLT